MNWKMFKFLIIQKLCSEIYFLNSLKFQGFTLGKKSKFQSFGKIFKFLMIFENSSRADFAGIYGSEKGHN